MTIELPDEPPPLKEDATVAEKIAFIECLEDAAVKYGNLFQDLGVRFGNLRANANASQSEFCKDYNDNDVIRVGERIFEVTKNPNHNWLREIKVNITIP